MTRTYRTKIVREQLKRAQLAVLQFVRDIQLVHELVEHLLIVLYSPDQVGVERDILYTGQTYSASACYTAP